MYPQWLHQLYPHPSPPPANSPPPVCSTGRHLDPGLRGGAGLPAPLPSNPVQDGGVPPGSRIPPEVGLRCPPGGVCPLSPTAAHRASANLVLRAAGQGQFEGTAVGRAARGRWAWRKPVCVWHFVVLCCWIRRYSCFRSRIVQWRSNSEVDFNRSNVIHTVIHIVKSKRVFLRVNRPPNFRNLMAF